MSFALNGPLPLDPRPEMMRMLSLENGGDLRPAAGPFIDTIENTGPALSKKLQRTANVLNPVPSLVTTPKVMATYRKVQKEFKKKGKAYALGRDLRHRHAKTIVRKAKPIAADVRHVFEV